MAISSSRLIYFGTPEFAVAPLKKLIEAGQNVVAVVTPPDKPAGRGKKMSPPPVKSFALENNIPVLQPEKLKDESFLENIRNLRPDLQVVVAFRMMPRQLWSIPHLGTFNLHASLLPQYRGAAPINHAIINGEKQTGLTTFFIDDKIDTGEILLQEKLEIGNEETAGELHDRMMIAGASLVLKTVNEIVAGRVQPKPQALQDNNKNELKPAPKIFKEDCRLEWNNSCVQLFNKIRGLSPYPAAYSFLTGHSEKIPTKIFRAAYKLQNGTEKPGSLISNGKDYLHVFCKDGFLDIQELQIAGRKKMNSKDFLRGFPQIEDFDFTD